MQPTPSIELHQIFLLKIGRRGVSTRVAVEVDRTAYNAGGDR